MKTFLFELLFLVLPSLIAAQQAPVPVEDEPHHHVSLKNESVVVMRVKVLPGESTLYHTHVRDRVAVQLADNLITEQMVGEPAGKPSPRRPGDVTATTSQGPYTHRVNNRAATDFDVLDVEFLHRPSNSSGQPAVKIEAENPSARVYKWVLAPGATAPMHTHERPYLIVAATPLTLKMTAPDGRFLAEEVKPGDFHWVDAKVTHSLANEGTSEGQIIEIELK